MQALQAQKLPRWLSHSGQSRRQCVGLRQRDAASVYVCHRSRRIWCHQVGVEQKPFLQNRNRSELDSELYSHAERLYLEAADATCFFAGRGRLRLMMCYKPGMLECRGYSARRLMHRTRRVPKSSATIVRRSRNKLKVNRFADISC